MILNIRYLIYPACIKNKVAKSTAKRFISQEIKRHDSPLHDNKLQSVFIERSVAYERNNIKRRLHFSSIFQGCL